jgi:hypothetical protein
VKQMADITYANLKLGLVHFLLKLYKYKANKASSEYVTYLENKNAQYPLIVLSTVEFDQVTIDQLAATLRSAKHDKVNVLKIALNNDAKPAPDLIVIDNPIFYKDKLRELFPNIDKLHIEAANDVVDDNEELSPEDLSEMLSDPEHAENKELRELTAKIRSGFTPVAWILFVMFMVLPIASLALTFWYGSKGSSYLSYGSVSALVFGGSDRNLTILAGQFWRIFTFGLNGGTGSIFVAGVEVLIIGFLIYSVSKYTEAAIGSLRLFVGVFIAYVLTGLFMTSVPKAITAGPYVILATLFSMLGFSTSRKKSPITVISRSKMILPGIVLLLLPLFDSNFTNYLVLIVAAGVSGSVMFLWNYNYKKVAFDLAAPLIIIGVALILPITLALSYSPIPADAGEDIYTIQTYLEIGWIKEINTGTNVLHHIGWTQLSFAPDADGVLRVWENGEWRK